MQIITGKPARTVPFGFGVVILAKARIQVYLSPPLDSSLRWNDIFEKVV
ncbi:MAG: hypothetical protein V1932_04845 [Chloroflexota bacterium]